MIQHQDGLSLHPDLLVWSKQLFGYKQRWYACADKNPLAWYATLTHTPPAALLAAGIASLPADTRQVWVASPYHAQLMRDSVRVLPEGQLAWTADDAVRVCDILNPLLAEEQMQLMHIGAALMLTCKQPLDVYPEGFAAIAGHLLPDCHHAGEDGGRMNRLLSEIQMLLFQHPSIQRHERHEPDVNGIWLWGAADWPQEFTLHHLPVATRNPFLQAIAEARDTELMISDSAQLEVLLQSGSPLPKTLVLAGEGHAVLLKKSWLPKLGKCSWQPKAVKEEPALITMLQSLL